MTKIEGKSKVIYMAKYRKPAVVRRIREREMIQAKIFMEMLISTGMDLQSAYEMLLDVKLKEKR